MNTKWKVITSVMFLIMTICAAFIGLLAKNCTEHLAGFIAEEVKSTRIVAQVIEEQLSSQYKTRIKSLISYKTSASREEMLQAFAHRDRKELLRLAMPLFQTMNRESEYLSTFGWVLPDNHAFLRVHNPKKFGGDVTKMRPDIVAANSTGQQVAGFTAGYVGLQYRIVQPVVYNGTHLGTIQFGIRDTLLLDPIQQKLKIPVGLVLPNETFKYIKRSKLPALPGPTHTIQAKNISLFKGSEDKFDWSQKQQRLLLKGKEYVVVKALDLNNFNGKPQGHLFVALDISSEVSKQHMLFWITLSLSAIILFLSFIILNRSYGRLVQKIVDLNTSLEQSNRELEDRVGERTEELLQEIEDRKAAEKERAFAEAKAQRSSKMEAIGLMAGGVAHDLNNILSGVISYPELILMQLPDDSELRKPVEAILDSGTRAAAVVADLLTVARGVASDKHVTNLNDLILEYFDSPECRKSRSFHPRIECVHEPDNDLFNISCSPVHVKKCLMNLVNNGLEAMGDKGKITVSTRNQYVDQPVAQNQYVAKGEYVVLSVEDNGSGIADKDLEHIFEPFYTKKKMGRSGTGLGLAIVWNTMLDHGGAVTIKSSEKGTTFELYFPSVREETKVLAEHTDLTDLKGNGENVLVVDDEVHQREIATQILTMLGYCVDSVSSGEEAVEYVQENSADLLVLDMIMGSGINGQQTYEQIVAISPGQKAIIASGFSETEDVKKTLALGAKLFIRKPYTMRQLGLAVKHVLDGHGNGTTSES